MDKVDDRTVEVGIQSQIDPDWVRSRITLNHDGGALDKLMTQGKVKCRPFCAVEARTFQDYGSELWCWWR